MKVIRILGTAAKKKPAPDFLRDGLHKAERNELGYWPREQTETDSFWNVYHPLTAWDGVWKKYG